MHSKIIVNPQLAVNELRRGKLVSFPTETVYGLGADASNLAAVQQVYRLKNRPLNHPLIVHVGKIEHLANIAENIPAYAYKLAQTFWPGAMTLVLKKSAAVNMDITGQQNTVAVRIPNHPVALAVLQEFPLGIVGPSANKFGRISPTSAQDVIDELGSDELFTAVLDGGPCSIGIESTIIDCSQEIPAILRHGQISAPEIEQVLGLKLRAQPTNIRISGNLKSHYAPRALTALASYQQIIEFIQQFPSKKIGVLALSAAKEFNPQVRWIEQACCAQNYAQNLYRNLRTLDQATPDYILIEEIPNLSAWQGINDRLRKASSQFKVSNLLNLTPCS